MTKRRGPSTAAELIAELNADPEFIAKQRERNVDIFQRTAALKIEQEPLLADLRAVDVRVQSVWDLLNRRNDYKFAIPTLLAHLQRPYSDVIRGGIARSLAMPDAAYAWHLLVDEYRKLPAPSKGQGLGAKNGLAVALSATSSDEVMAELIALAKDRSHGSSRILLLPGLRRSKLPVAKEAIEHLAEDDQLALEINSWNRKGRRPRS